MMNECCKFTVCVFSLFAQQQFSVRKSIRAFKDEIIGKPFETMKLIVPSGLYCLQNNLLFVALTNLDAATYQVSTKNDEFGLFCWNFFDYWSNFRSLIS